MEDRYFLHQDSLKGVSTYSGKVLIARYSGLSLRTTNKILLKIVLRRIALSRQKNPVTKRLDIHLSISEK